MESLCNYAWPGNVRQLRNTIQRAIVMGSTDIIQPQDLPPALFPASTPPRSQPRTLGDAVLQTQREFVQKTFALADDDYDRAASMLKISRKNIRRLLGRLKLLPPCQTLVETQGSVSQRGGAATKQVMTFRFEDGDAFDLDLEDYH